MMSGTFNEQLGGLRADGAGVHAGAAGAVAGPEVGAAGSGGSAAQPR